MSNIEIENVTEETFRDFIPYSFTTVSSDGRVVELREGGAEQDVTWHNRFEFVELVEKYRLEEFSLQLKALQKGLATIVPVQLLRSLFTFDELELMAVGKREIDIDHLRVSRHSIVSSSRLKELAMSEQHAIQARCKERRPTRADALGGS